MSASPRRLSRMGTRAVPELCVFDLDACLWDKVGAGQPLATAARKLVVVSFERLCFVELGWNLWMEVKYR